MARGRGVTEVMDTACPTEARQGKGQTLRAQAPFHSCRLPRDTHFRA